MKNNDLTVEVKAEPADAGLENAPPVMAPKRAAEGGNDAERTDHADHAEQADQPPRNARDAGRDAARALDAAPRTEPARPAQTPPDAASLNARSEARGTGVHDRDRTDGADDAARSRSQAAGTLKAGGLDIAAFEAEYAQNGALSQESYARLEEAGLTRDVVDRYIEAQAIAAEKTVADLKAAAGGEEAYARMTQWAREALAAEDIETFNRIMDSGDLGMIRLAVSGLAARWKEAEGAAPAGLIRGAARAGSAHGDVFESAQEVVAAMRDKRYGRDPAYTRSVERRLGRSQVF